jgi:hypothetical protein
MRIALTAGALAATLGPTSIAAAQDVTFDKTFLNDYSRLAPRQNDRGIEFLYISPRAVERTARYEGVMVDEPEILISPDSPYKGAKPENLLSIAHSMRDAMDARLSKGHYKLVDEPGPGVIYVRVALTDLQLDKKKRAILEYTPIGITAGSGFDALKEFQSKFDILKLVFQAEITDSATNEVYAQYVMVVGDGREAAPIDFDKVKENMDEFGERLRCRLDNAQGPVDKQINCLDAAARDARESAKAAD